MIIVELLCVSQRDVTVTDDQVEQFYEQGYLVIENAFDDEEVTRMQQEADYILELIINSSLANDRKSGRLDLVEEEDGSQQIRKIQPINDLSRYLSEVSDDDRLLNPMRRIMDDEPILMEEKLNYKEPLPEPIESLEGDRPTSGFPVHNDWAYYRVNGYPQNIISSAIAIDDCTPENGPLEIWPGSHKEHIEHQNGPNGYEVPPDDIDYDAGEKILAPAGSVMFFHSLLVHSSSGNESDEPRRLMIYSHYPEDEGEKTGISLDERNGPARLSESPWEEEYHRLKERGDFEDQVTAPSF